MVSGLHLEINDDAVPKQQRMKLLRFADAAASGSITGCSIENVRNTSSRRWIA